VQQPKATVIVGILEEHLEELAYLWGQRRSALRSPEYTLRELHDLEERIEARVHGLLAGREHTVPLLEDGLSQDDPLVVFAAAYTFLRMGNDLGAHKVTDAFFQATRRLLDGIREALCHGPIDNVLSSLQRALATASAGTAAAAAEILAFHSRLDPRSERLQELLKDANPGVRRAAWRIVAFLGSSSQ
jgi:uncharacterized protein (TIGR02270 family)